VGRRYAGALFDVAAKKGDAGAPEHDLRAFRDLVAGHPELARVLDTPAVPPQKKRAIVEALVAKMDLRDPEVGRLLLMLAERDRLALLPDVLDAYVERLMASRRVVTADVTTAMPLAEPQRAALATALTKASGSDVTIRETVDPSIVGGVIARVGSVVFDGSVVTQIARMRQKLLQE
jgi:F-type H+-transporting ATPase subunit delta